MEAWKVDVGLMRKVRLRHRDMEGRCRVNEEG
jgi:hypothetical protein